MLCAIWYHFYDLKNAKNTHGRMLILVKLQAGACKFFKSNTPPWVFFTVFKLYKWYQIAQSVSMVEYLGYYPNSHLNGESMELKSL